LQLILDYTRKENNPESGEELAEIGLQMAVSAADRKYPKWSDRCWDLFKRWLSKKERGFQFLIEDFREAVYKWKMIEKPKSDRAFGFISQRAIREKLIVNAGTRKVKNAKAHATPANLWKKV
jgi:hypothetical protein